MKLSWINKFNWNKGILNINEIIEIAKQLRFNSIFWISFGWKFEMIYWINRIYLVQNYISMETKI